MRFIISGILLCLQFACSAIPTHPSITEANQNREWLKHRKTIESLEHWNIHARFVARNETDAWNGNITWLQENQQFDILVSGPLSSGSLILRGNSNHSTLQIAEDKIYEASDAQALLESVSGIRLPVNQLQFWLRGLPAPNAPLQQIKIDDQGRINELSQNDWRIFYKAYIPYNSAYLPTKIFMENHEFDVRLLIQAWNQSV